ncbi:MAG: hypothetical protein LC808_37820 [Actinobacteria bacterium]|nr:hypothetical protein [Actinomycetota bacterium]
MRRVRIPSKSFRSGSAFDGSRSLRIVLDDALGADEASDLLRGFSSNGKIEVWSTAAEDGVGHIELEPYDAESDSVRYRVGNTRSGISAARQWPQFAQQMSEEGLASYEEAYRTLLLAQIARNLGADVLATRAPLLLETAPRGLVRDANPMTPEEGVAIMGLYLRLVGDFTVLQNSGGGSYRVNRGLWYWVLTRDLLESGWRWFSACVESSTATEDDRLTYLGQSVLRRFDRALRSRDRVLQQSQLPPDNDTSDEAIFYLDVALLMLNGAFDAGARVVHLTYALSGDPSNAGWRKANWRKRLLAADSAFEPLLADESRARDVLDLVGLLRNTIHGAGLQAISVSDAGQAEQSREHGLGPGGGQEPIACGHEPKRWARGMGRAAPLRRGGGSGPRALHRVAHACHSQRSQRVDGRG